MAHYESISYRVRNKNIASGGFTIIELLIVISIIGILATVISVSYLGVSTKAIETSLKSDLSVSAEQLKLYEIKYDKYPDSLDANYCPTSPGDSGYCLKASGDNYYTYSVDNASNPKTFILDATNNDITYRVTDSVAVYRVISVAEVPDLTLLGSSLISNVGANLSADIISTGGSQIQDRGFCWGEASNPTSNCVSAPAGSLLDIGDIATGTMPTAVTVSSDGTSVYVVNFASANIYNYNRDISSGELTYQETLSTGAGPYSVTVSPDNKSVYVANVNSTTLSIYSRNPSTGILISQGTIATGSQPRSVTVSPDNKSVYVSNYGSHTISIYSRDLSTGALTSQGDVAIAGESLSVVVSPDGKSVYANSDSASDTISIYSRDADTGSLVFQSSIATGNKPRHVAVSPDNKSVYVANYGSDTISIYSRDLSTGALVDQGVLNVGHQPYSVVVSPDGLSVYTTYFFSTDPLGIYNREVSSGALTYQGSMGNESSQYSSFVSSDGRSLYVANFNSNDITAYRRNASLGVGEFGISATSMPSDTLIYYRAYADNATGRGYSEDGSFSTLP